MARAGNEAKTENARRLALIAVIIILMITVFVRQRRQDQTLQKLLLGTQVSASKQIPPPMAPTNFGAHAVVAKDKVSLEETMNLSLKLQFDPRANPEIEAAILTSAKKLAVADLSRLSAQAVRESAGNNERNAALFILLQARENAIAQLAEVANQPVRGYPNEANPEGRDALQKKFETSLRVKALEALDEMTNSRSSEIKQAAALEVARVASQQTQPTVQFLADLSLSGLREGRPGKLQRFIGRAMDESDQERKSDEGISK